MKKLISLVSLIIISLNLTSCKITQEGLWGVDTYKEEFTGFTISEGGDVILIGKKYHYLLENSHRLKKMLTSKLSHEINFMHYSYLVVKPNYKINFRLDLENVFSKESDSITVFGTRYIPTKKDVYKIYPLKLAKPFEEDIVEEPSALKTTSKILLTPFAVAADILMIPLYIIGLGGMIAAE
jgi:hypothetical protein